MTLSTTSTMSSTACPVAGPTSGTWFATPLTVLPTCLIALGVGAGGGGGGGAVVGAGCGDRRRGRGPATA